MSASSLANLCIGYRLSLQTQISLDVFNLFDGDVNNIEYWHGLQLPNEASSLFDRHIHPAEPGSFRLTLNDRF